MQLGAASVTQSFAEGRINSSSASYMSPESAMSFREGKVGFLGPTSYSAVFTENSGSLGILEQEEVDDQHLAPISAEKINQGAEVLALLRDMPLYERFTQRFFEMCDGILVPYPAYRIWVDDLWTEFGQLLASGGPEQLRSLSELVWRNTRRPLNVHGSMSAQEWARSVTGRGLRWEVVGTILSLTGLTAGNLSHWDSIFDAIRERYIDRATFVERMRRVSEHCLCFCYESEVLNDVYIAFMYQDLSLVECLKGKSELCHRPRRYNEWASVSSDA